MRVLMAGFLGGFLVATLYAVSRIDADLDTLKI